MNNIKIIEKSKTKYNFDIDIFEGPLDLLLLLTKQQKIDIENISIMELVNQYIVYIFSLDKIGINIASEYIEMTADLLILKSKMMLNMNNNNDVDEDINNILSKEELLKKIIEYKKYKEISTVFFEKIKENERRLYKTKSKMLIYREENELDNFDINLFKMVSLNWKKDIKLKKEEKIINFNENDIKKMADKFKLINNKINFTNKIKNLKNTEKIINFLGLLEAIKLEYISIVVDDINRIFIYSKE